MTPDVDEILRCWRRAICFADTVRLGDGEFATVIGGVPSNPEQLDLVLGNPSQASKGRARLTRDMVFPAWWPECQFRSSEIKRETK